MDLFESFGKSFLIVSFEWFMFGKLHGSIQVGFRTKFNVYLLRSRRIVEMLKISTKSFNDLSHLLINPLLIFLMRLLDFSQFYLRSRETKKEIFMFPKYQKT